MKKFNFIYGALIASVVTFAACNPNDYPEFDDADAFVAFTSTTLSVDEFEGSLDVPMLLTSLAGLDGTAQIEVDTEASTAVEGVHFTFASEKSVSFTGEAPNQSVKLNVIDNADFGGDVKLVLNIVSATGVNLGAVKTCTITITDDEHPLQLILGRYVAKGLSYFNGETEWALQIVKDPTDISKVWIYPFVPKGTSFEIYGIVNEDLTEIRIPVGQEIASSSNAPDGVGLQGFRGAEGEEGIAAGDYIYGAIDANGNITIEDWFGSNITGTNSWYNIMVGAVLTKQ